MSSLQNMACLLNEYSNVLVTGKDAQKFLQGQLSCDLTEITDKKPGIGCYCNIKGRVLAFFDIFTITDGYILNLPSNVSEKLVSALKKYAIFSKVEITIDSNLKTIGIYNTDDSIIKCVDENTSHIYRLDLLSNSYKILSNNESISNIQSILEANGVKIFDDTSKWKEILISNKVPVIAETQSEKYLPAELNLDKTKSISFTKGCFMGQEVIARMKYIGKMKKSLQLINVTSSEKVIDGQKLISENKAIGEIINLAATEYDNYVALSLLNNEIIENNKEIRLEDYNNAEISVI